MLAQHSLKETTLWLDIFICQKMAEHEEERMVKIDFDQGQSNFLPKGNDQDEDQYFASSFRDVKKDLVGEQEFVTIIRIGNEPSEVEVG